MKISPLPVAMMLAACALAAGCASPLKLAGDGREAEKEAIGSDPVDVALQAQEPDFYVNYAGGTPGDDYTIGFSVGSSPASQRIRSFEARIFNAYGSRLAQITTDRIDASGTANGSTGTVSGMIYGSTAWSADVGAGTYAVLLLRTDSGVVARYVPFPGGEQAAAPTREAALHERILAMVLTSERRGSGTEFRLSVRRIAAPPDGEYLPSGEKFRIDVIDGSGRTVWSSSNGRSFTQAIGSVDPAEVGAETEYRAMWDGRDDLAHGRAAPGTYRIVATIPAKPTPYILREEFTWSGR